MAATVAGLVAVGLMIAACSEHSGESTTSLPLATTTELSTPPASAPVASIAVQGAFETVFDRADAVARLRPVYLSVADAMPTVAYRTHTGEEFRVSDTFVVGEYVGIEPGVSLRWDEDAPDDTPIQLPFGDPAAMASTVHATIDVVDSVLVDGTSGLDRDTIAVGIVVGTRTISQPFARSSNRTPRSR